MHYLDNAATTVVLPAVADVADAALRRLFANPSSLYAPGFESEQAITTARGYVAKTLGCKPEELLFTASGTEGNNLAIHGAAMARTAWANHIVVTGYEHPSVQNTVDALCKAGAFSAGVIAPDAQGHVDLQRLIDAVTPQTALVCAMHVNNEIGSVLDVAALARAVKQKNSRTAVHVDGVQAWGKIPVALNHTDIDTYTISGHKQHAPKGVGALYVRKGYNFAPSLFGGLQERGLRPGTENIAFIAAMGEAARLQPKADAAAFAPLRDALLARLRAFDFITLNSPEDAFAGVVNFSVTDIKSETMLHFLEQREIYVSSGSACGRGAASHTLAAMGLPKSRVDTALRVSFSTQNTLADVDALAHALAEGERTLAKIHR